MKIRYSNMPSGSNKLNFLLRYIFNFGRTYFLFHFKYPWVKYHGFVRVMKRTSFARMKVNIGHHVQFGEYCNVANNVIFKNNILIAGRVCFVGKEDHDFSKPGQLIWDGERKDNGVCIVEDDVWIGHGCTIVGNITISRGSIIAAGSLVTKNIPECEIWGGVPAKKIKNRFPSDHEKQIHLHFLNTIE